MAEISGLPLAMIAEAKSIHQNILANRDQRSRTNHSFNKWRAVFQLTNCLMTLKNFSSLDEEGIRIYLKDLKRKFANLPLPNDSN